MTAGTAGLEASVATRPGMRYEWTISLGLFTGAAGAAGVTGSDGRNRVTYTASEAGPLTLTCVEINAAGTRSAPATHSLRVEPAPLAPSIRAPASVAAGAAAQAAVTARPGLRYEWTVAGATVTSAGGAAGVTGGGQNTITFSAGPSGSVQLGCVEINALGARSAAGTASVAILAAPEPPPAPVISGPSAVTEGVPGQNATVPARAGSTYRWSISNGVITSSLAGVTAGSTNTVTFTPGSAGPTTLSCVETDAGGLSSSPGTLTVNVLAAPLTPTLRVTSPASAGEAGLSASVVARAGMTYRWTVAGGVLSGPSSGVTRDGLNTITFQAGAPGTLSLSCTEHNAAGAQSAAGSATVQVLSPPPLTPTISAGSTLVPGEFSSASVSARPYMAYRWAVTNGRLLTPAGTTSGGVNSIQYEAGAEGPLTLTCTEVAADGRESAPAQALVTVVAPAPRGGTAISGALQGTLTKAGSPYLVTGNIHVPRGQRLTLEPGVQLRFQGHYAFRIYGALTARGTAAEKILFTADNPTEGWFGLRWEGTHDGATAENWIEHCIFEYANKSHPIYWDGYPGDVGGALYIENVHRLHLNDNLFRFNKSQDECGAVVFHFSMAASFSNNVFEDNESGYEGGALCFWHFIPGDSTFQVNGGAFRRNRSRAGSAHYFDSRCPQTGGAVDIFDPHVDFCGVQFEGNLPDDIRNCGSYALHPNTCP